MNTLQDMNGELADHAALELAILVRHISHGVFLTTAAGGACIGALTNAGGSRCLLHFSLFGFVVDQDLLLVGHGRREGCDQAVQLVAFVARAIAGYLSRHG